LLTPAADIYSLGVLLVELLTGQSVLANYEGPELIAAKRLLAVPDMESAGLPAEVSLLASRMLSRDPLRRPMAHEVVETLIACEISALSG
jgi:serine/threonine protein kinase